MFVDSGHGAETMVELDGFHIRRQRVQRLRYGTETTLLWRGFIPDDRSCSAGEMTPKQRSFGWIFIFVDR